VRLLLDTHVVLWALGDPASLAERARAAISDPANVAVVSAASLWEVSTKQATGRISVPDDFVEEVWDAGFEPLPISAEHAWAAGALPLHHRDPFDRMLVAQAQLEGFTIVTGDSQLGAYQVAILAA
jgi:PIN domain nuclease of toxin-antitoxin system